MKKRIRFTRGRRHQELAEIRKLTTMSIIAGIIIILSVLAIYAV